MSFSSAMRRGIILAVLVLLNASLHLADRRLKVNGGVGQVPAKRPQPKKTRPTSSPINHALCDATSVPILPPSFIYSGSLWSVRALMFLQILPDGTVNGTLESNKYAKLDIEIVSENGCMVRIKGMDSKLYLVMGVNGSLIAQTEPDQTRSIFTVQLEKSNFFTFKIGNYFIALKQGGGIKKVKGGENGRSHRRSTRFVLLPRLPARKRRFPADFGLKRTSSNNLRLKLFGDFQRR